MALTKGHIIKMPRTQVPTEYPRDSKLASVSIPLFYSKTGYSQHFDDIHTFNRDSFKNVMVKGAIWSAVSILTNTDFGENGIPIYFHVEDVLYDMVAPELKSYGVPDDWIRKWSFPDFNPEYIHPDEGSPIFIKKFGIILDESIDTDIKMIFDADAFVYRRIGDPILKWTRILEKNFRDKFVFQFYGGEPIGDIKHVNWLRTGLSIEPISTEEDGNMIYQSAEIECYERLGLRTKFGRNRSGNAIMSYCRNEKFLHFLKTNLNKCYQDEAILTMFTQAEGNEDIKCSSFNNEEVPLLGWLREDDLQNYLDVSRIIHPSGVGENWKRWFNKFKKGIDGRGRENAIKLFRTPRKNIHIFPVAHNPVSPEFSSCAFAQKGRKLAYMCKYTDHNVTFYGNEIDKDVVDCDEFVVVSTEESLNETYGDFRDQSNFYWFRDDDYNSRITRENIIHHYGKRHQKEDILCYTFGHQQRKLYDRLLSQFNNALHIESGIGYYQPYMHYKVFETNSHMQYSYGEAGKRHADWDSLPEENRPQRDFNNTFHYGMTQWQDKVICNSWGEDEFDYNPNKGGDYLLFIGRIVGGKGVEIAMRVAAALGKKLIVAGQGDFKKELGFEPWDCVELVGMVKPEKRRELYYNCEAVLAPTKYLDVLCGVTIEAGFSGRPIIGPDFGGPKEVIEHKLTGYQCRSFCQYVRATANAHLIEPSDCKKNAMRYTNEEMAPKYDEYFDHITRYAGNSCSVYWYHDLNRGIDW